MRAYTLLVLIVILSPCTVLGADYNGQWLGTIIESIDRCQRLGKGEPGDYKLTIIHEEDGDLTLMENVVQRPYSGVVNPKKPSAAVVQGTYVDDGGYVSEMVNIDFKDESTGRGMSVWSWTDGYHSCGGRFSFTLEKIRP
jgi:hypothetical protein